MKRTTIFVDEVLETNLRAIAQGEKRPVSSVVREALEVYVARRQSKARRISFIALGRSGHRDTAEKHEDLLWQDRAVGTAQSDRTRGRARRRSVSKSRSSQRKRR